MRVSQRSFTSGEVGPSVHGRTDLTMYATGLSTCRNCYPLVYGGVARRPGTRFIAEALDSSSDINLIPFEFNAQQAYILEFGDYSLRILKDGGLVAYEVADTPAWADATAYSLHDSVNHGGLVYRCIAAHTSALADNEPGVGASWDTKWVQDPVVVVASPYASADVKNIKYTQSADVLYLTCKGVAPHKLTRTDHHAWSFETLTFSLTTPKPVNVTKTVTGMTGTDVTYSYKVAAVVDGVEGPPSDPVDASLPSPWPEGGVISIACDPVADVERYRFYKNTSGSYGFIGTSDTESFTDENVEPDFSDTPKSPYEPFEADEYPEVVCLSKQRLWFANSNKRPQTFWASPVGEYEQWFQSFPLKDDDAFSYTIADSQVNAIKWIASIDKLLMGTIAKERKLGPTNSNEGLTATNVDSTPQSANGSNDVPPIITGNAILHVSYQGDEVRDLTYSLEVDGYSGDDLAVKSPHLLRFFSLQAWAYAKTPDALVWAVRSDGTLLSLTYKKEHEVFGWARHDTKNGFFRDVASIPGDGLDEVYVVVERTINGQTVKYIEAIMEGIGLTGETVDGVAELDNTELWFSDAAAKYEGSATTDITGLDYLEGEAVAVLADGNVVPGMTVSGGQITLPYAAEKVIVGLPIEPVIETLPVDVDYREGTSQTVIQSIPGATLRVLDSRGFWAGAVDENGDAVMYEQTVRSIEDLDGPIPLRYMDYSISVDGVSGRQGRFRITQPDPIPLTVLLIIPEVDLAG